MTVLGEKQCNYYLFVDTYRSKESRVILHQLLAGQFCFVRTEDGHVVQVYYEEGSHPEGLNLKKTIAAAFQANFRHQKEEEEQDPQSLYVAHYRYVGMLQFSY